MNDVPFEAVEKTPKPTGLLDVGVLSDCSVGVEDLDRTVTSGVEVELVAEKAGVSSTSKSLSELQFPWSILPHPLNVLSSGPGM